MVEAQEGLVDRQFLASEWRKEKSSEEPWGPTELVTHRQGAGVLAKHLSQLQPSTQSKKGAETGWLS